MRYDPIVMRGLDPRISAIPKQMAGSSLAMTI
jgi:hypothetical protein